MTKIWREVLWIVLNLQWKIKRDLYSVIIWHQRIFFLSSLCGNRNSCEVIKFLMSDRGERERTRTVLLPPKPIYTSTALKCPSSISCSNQGVIIYTNSRSFPRTQQACTSLEYATAQDFPRHLHRNRKVQIQAYSGHKGNCTSLSCIWMHFSLLRDENITSSFYSFMHILLHFFAFLTNSLGQFWKCLKFLKKMKGNKKKMKESENVHFKLLPLCPPKLFSNWYFLFGCEITDSQWDFPVLHQT